MKIRVNPKEAQSIITALEAGIVPRKGVRHLLVGRNDEVQEIISILSKIEEGNSDIRFWVGDFGSGKSFMMRTIESIGLQRNFIVSTVDLTPTRRFYASDGKSRALYNEIVNNITTQSSQTGNTIAVILEEWISKLAHEIALDNNVDINHVLSKEFKKMMIGKIIDTTSSFSSTGLSFEFGQAIIKFYEGIIDDDTTKQIKALRWLRGEVETKTESKQELGIPRIINDDNWYDAIKALSELFSKLDYSGFIINFDECVNLYKIPLKQTRERNYEKILNIYNECKSSAVKNLFINFGATRKTIFDDYRGLSSYGALKGRLGDERSMDSKLINTNRTVLPLKPLNDEEIFTLLDHLVEIYNIHYKSEIRLDLSEIHLYMEEQLNRPGAEEFLTPRSVIKDFLEILDMVRQNPNEKITEVILLKFGKNGMPVTRDENDNDDEIEIF